MQKKDVCPLVVLTQFYPPFFCPPEKFQFTRHSRFSFLLILYPDYCYCWLAERQRAKKIDWERRVKQLVGFKLRELHHPKESPQAVDVGQLPMTEQSKLTDAEIDLHFYQRPSEKLRLTCTSRFRTSRFVRQSLNDGRS